MGVGISGGDVRLVELQAGVDQTVRNGVAAAELGEEISHRVPPCFRPHRLEDRLHSLLGSLLSREAGPLIEARVYVAPCVLEITLGLLHPITASFHASPGLHEAHSSVSQARSVTGKLLAASRDRSASPTRSGWST